MTMASIWCILLMALIQESENVIPPLEQHSDITESFGNTALDGFRRKSFTDTTIVVGCYQGGIFTAPIDTLQFTSLTGSSASDVTGTAYDPIEDKLYWVEYDYNRIARCNADGSGVETFLTSGVLSPFGIEFDSKNRQLYWSDSGTGSVKRVDIDGQNAVTISSGGTSLRKVSMDNKGSRIYWSDYGTHQIGSVNTDGSDLRFINGLTKPWGLHVDSSDGRLYYTQYSPGAIVRSELSGAQQHVLATEISRPTDLDIHNNDLYYIIRSSSGKMLYKMSQDGTSSPVPVGSGLDGHCVNAYSIQIIPMYTELQLDNEI